MHNALEQQPSTMYYFHTIIEFIVHTIFYEHELSPIHVLDASWPSIVCIVRSRRNHVAHLFHLHDCSCDWRLRSDLIDARRRLNSAPL